MIFKVTASWFTKLRKTKTFLEFLPFEEKDRNSGCNLVIKTIKATSFSFLQLCCQGLPSLEVHEASGERRNRAQLFCARHILSVHFLVVLHERTLRKIRSELHQVWWWKGCVQEGDQPLQNMALALYETTSRQTRMSDWTAAGLPLCKYGTLVLEKQTQRKTWLISLNFPLLSTF